MSGDGYAAFLEKDQEDPSPHKETITAHAAARVGHAGAGRTIPMEEARYDAVTQLAKLSDEHLELIAGGLLLVPFAVHDQRPA